MSLISILTDNVGTIAVGSLGSLFVVVLVVVVFIVLVIIIKKTKSEGKRLFHVKLTLYDSSQLSDNKVPKVAAGPVYVRGSRSI